MLACRPRVHALCIHLTRANPCHIESVRQTVGVGVVIVGIRRNGSARRNSDSSNNTTEQQYDCARRPDLE